MPVVILPGAPLDRAAGAFVPLAADSADRIEAVTRFWRAGRGLDAPDTRLTPRRRQRIPTALRAADAHAQGASYREPDGGRPLSETPYGRPGQPVEIAPVYVLLASNDASFVNGEVYGVTGGDGIA